MAVADVRRAVGNVDPMRKGAAAGDDEIVGGELELRYRKWKQR